MLYLNDISHILSKYELPTEKLRAILSDLKQTELANKEEKAADATEKAKNTLVPILLDPEGKLAGVTDLVALIVQVPENMGLNDILPKIYDAAYTQNRDAKRKRWTFGTIVDVASHGKRKYLKERDVHCKTKEVVPVIVTNGIIPTV